MSSQRPLITFAAVIVITVISTATFAVLPAFVRGAQLSLHFSSGDVGLLAAMINAGGALGSVIAKYWVRRFAWRKAAYIALLGMVLGNALSIVLHDRTVFVSLQFIAGIFAGSLLSLTLTMLSDEDNPDRAFGVVIAGQVALQAIGLFAGPALLRLGGIDALLITLCILTGACFLLVGRLPMRGKEVRAILSATTRLQPGALMALLGSAFFMMGASCYWTYIAPLGHDAGFDEDHIARSLVVGVVAGFLGALTAAYVGSRRPRNTMLALGMVMVIGAVLLLLGHIDLTSFVASWCLLNFSWNFSATYQYAGINSADSSGRSVALAPAFQSTGAAIGPAIAALFVAPHAYGSVMWLVCGGVILSVVCFVFAPATIPLATESSAANAAQGA
jgi:DHA1 family inner membrane transport protein